MSESGRMLGGITGRGFMPGQSGNPSGRSKAMVEVEEAARAHTTAAIETLATIAGDEAMPPPARVAACVALLDRGWGKPRVSVEANVNVNEALAARLDAARERVAQAVREGRT
ncbi:hypothetical protein M0638_27660 [Roseomonas sp. NAR14]|uniref:DUF5681 domain-containing protein n=1 Tax=Roseomonas acroporae TaxID=2937791 RepID=A0A9X1YFF5_9PROT|nr:hypothetical protein [Roseomonas acroporae]MCK8788135.1 hypothetical protein [Roseomonas acroporae]